MDHFYPIVVVVNPPEDGGGYLGFAPDLMGCMSNGDSAEEAFASTHDAVLEWLDEAKESKREIPAPGSYSMRAKVERDKLLSVIKDQDDAIEGLSEELRKATHVIDGLKSTVRGVMQRVEDLPMWSGFVMAQISRDGTAGEDSVH